MTPSHRAWTERFVAEIETRIALYGRIGFGREGEAVVLACLRDVVDRHRRALAAAPAPSPVVTATPAAAPVAATAALGPVDGARDWRNSLFWRRGYFQPFAGTHADRMIASAETCRRLGYDAAATSYEAIAAAAHPVAAATAIDDEAQARLASVAAFTAGPQMGLFG